MVYSINKFLLTLKIFLGVRTFFTKSISFRAEKCDDLPRIITSHTSKICCEKNRPCRPDGLFPTYIFTSNLRKHYIAFEQLGFHEQCGGVYAPVLHDRRKNTVEFKQTKIPVLYRYVLLLIYVRIC